MAPIKTGMNGVREALKPLFILASICGAQMFEYRVLFLNYIHFVLFWTCYYTGFAVICIYLPQIHWFQRIDFSRLAEGFQAIANMIGSALTFMHKKKFQNCLERISLINTTLEEINIPNEYSNLRTLAWKMIGIWCLSVVYNIFTDCASIVHNCETYAAVLVVLVLIYPRFINYLILVIMCILLRYIGSRFDWINKYIGERIKDGKYKTKLPDKCGMYDLWNPVVEKKQERDIWMIMHLHRNLCKISRELNALLSLAIILEIGYCFLYLCFVVIIMCFAKQYNIKCYIIFICFPRKTMLTILFIWAEAVICIARMIYFNHMCESVSAKANSTRTLLHVFLNSINGAQSRRELSQFIMHIVHRPLKFNGAGMIDFGYGFVYRFFGTLSTCTVIIMQSSYSWGFPKLNNTSS